jgi:hypothetical protein
MQEVMSVTPSPTATFGALCQVEPLSSTAVLLEVCVRRKRARRASSRSEEGRSD